MWWDFKTTSGFAVMPEAQIVPTDPVVAEPTPGTGGTGNPVASLRAGSTGYGREFRHCYVAGVDKGVCAVFVTLNASSTWPYSSAIYGHTLVLHGTDLADSGYVTLDGALPGGTVPASTGIIAFQ
jgi:hypothetical protein